MARRPSASPALAALAAAASLLGLAGPRAAAAEPAASDCRVLELEMTPTGDLQIVIWIEDAAGGYVDTAFITRTTGSYGLGNRPGIMDFKSGPWWPYGRRLSTFPVWAHRHGIEWPAVVFQDEEESNLSHDLSESSRELFYCRPIEPDEPLWDAESCASTVWTDKGKLDDAQVSRYPPRADLEFDADRDHDQVADYAAMNPFDAVSRATPLADQPFAVVWPLPEGLPDGDYVVWMEVAREFDQNEAYDFPSPDVAFGSYGVPYRGQPSVVYRVEVAVARGETTASTLDYVGYGDPDGVDGELRPPDDTIATTPGSGAGRLLVTTDGGDSFRLRVRAHGEPDAIAPGAVGAPTLLELAPTELRASFVAPGDDALAGAVAGYEVRYLAGGGMDEASWDRAARSGVQIAPAAAGTVHEFTLDGLLPQTRYAVGIRAYDECYNVGPLALLDATTPRPEGAAVDACFVATAAYGSLLANDVVALRGFRDRALRSTIAGELLVEAYYTFGPLAARAIAPSDALRRAARGALAPAVALARRVVDRLPFLR